MTDIRIVPRRVGSKYQAKAYRADTTQLVYEGRIEKSKNKAVNAVRRALRNTNYQEVP